MAAPAETRTPNLHRAKETLIESADGRVATVVARKRLWGNSVGLDKCIAHVGPPSLRAEWWPSGPPPSRVRCAAQNAPLTAPGRSARCSARREGGLEERQQQKQHQNRKLPLDLDGILMEGVIATLRLLFARWAKGKRELVLSRCCNSYPVSFDRNGVNAASPQVKALRGTKP